MPSSVGYGAAVCRRADETISVSPTPTNSSFGEGSADSKDFREYSGRSWSRSDSAMDRHSESSESLDNHSTSSGHERHLQDFGAEYIPTRTTKLNAPKPAYNPMQFVKTGPAKLCESARLQMQKATEVKKVREVKKEESEDWQANLEGWKSSRRKRQEHVIERVTEVKRIEQEEAVRAADAAAKRNRTFTEMMGKRGSRSRLLALYSTDESEESEIPASPARDDDDFPENRTTAAEERENLSNSQAEEECPTRGESDVSEYTYDKAIADYVKFTSTALSKSSPPVEREQPEDRRSESRTASGDGNNMETANVSSVQRRSLKVQQTLASLQASQAADKPSNNLSGGVEVVAEVSKRRSFFESAAAAAEDKEKEAAKSQHRKSGDFSSSFKNRLAAFASSDSSEDSKRNSPVRDPEFRQKLSTFQAVESKQETTVKFTDGSTRSSFHQSETSITTVCQSEKPRADNQQPGSAFCQLETSVPDQSGKDGSDNSQSNAASPQQAKLTETTGKLYLHQLERITPELDQSGRDLIYKDQSQTISIGQSEPKNSFRNHLEPPAPVAAASNSSAESDDYTEDEGIRSLSPRGTDSPPSPAESNQPITEIIKSFHFKETMNAPQKMAEPQKPAVIEEVWDASTWVISDVSHVAPPVEKPPPPPPDDSDETSAPGYFHGNVAKDSAMDSASLKKVRSELRKRRSDFLGIDVTSDAQHLLEDAEVPPPPDLKSLLREAEFRTTDLRMYADETVVEDTYVETYYAGETEEDELARVEREIIESLEKEELERQQQINEDLDEYITEGLDKLETSYDEDSAAIKNNIALLDTLAAPAYKPRVSNKIEEIHFAAHDAAESSKSVREAATSGPVHSDKPKPPPVPAKPSRLSAAPKPRLHDGETWMAKRKAAVEGQRKEKDISRHWLIQEAEQRRITEQQERNHAPSHWGSMPSVAQPLAPSPANQEWLSRSSSSTSMDKVSRPDPSPHLYSNQEEIFQYADFTHSPEVWQVRSVNTGSIDHLQQLAAREEKQVLQHSKSVSQLASQKEPARRSTLPPETAKEPIAPLPDSVIHTLTQRVAQRSANYADYMNIQEAALPPKAAPQVPPSRNKHAPLAPSQSAPSLGGAVVQSGSYSVSGNASSLHDKMLSVSGKKKCSLCSEELGRGAAMIIESLRLFYHISCFRCCVCGVPLGNGTSGTDVRVRNNHLHCHDCYSNDEGLKFSKV